MLIPQATPEEKGIPSRQIIRFYERLKQHHAPLHSVILYKDGAVISQAGFNPCTLTDLHRCFSIAKNMAALAIGILSDRGLVSLSAPIASYFPEKLPQNPHPWIMEMTVRDLLMMRTCHASTTYNKMDETSDWVASFFQTPPDHRPGTIFHYDTSGALVLGALAEKITKQALMEFLKEALAPLDLSKECCILPLTQKGIEGKTITLSHAGSGLMATSYDLLKIGLLLLNEGTIEGQTLISQSFMKEALSCLTSTAVTAPLPSEGCGYGYTFWQTQRGGIVCYGMGGQLILVQPQRQMILVTTGDTQGLAGGNQIIYDAFYEEIYDREGIEAISSHPLRASLDLRQVEKGLCLPGLHEELGLPLSLKGPSVQKSFTLRANDYGYESLTLSSGKEGGSLCLSTGSQTLCFAFAFDGVKEFSLPLYQDRAFGSALWLDEETLYIRVRVIDRRVGNLHLQVHLSKDGCVTLFMRKVEETLYREFTGHYFGVPSKD